MNRIPAANLLAFQALTCRRAHEFINVRVRPRMQPGFQPTPTIEAGSFIGCITRTLAWTHTLSKLDEPVDFQAAVGASRTLFEIAVDVTLMHFEPSGYPVRRLLAWGDSAKLKAAMRIKEYFRRRGESPTEQHGPAMQFILARGEQIRAIRNEHWNGSHPNRWTGHGLEQDAREASRLLPKGEFEEFYGTQYDQVCWNTHGSGIAGFGGIPDHEIPGLSAVALRDCASFALLIAEVVLLHFGMWDANTSAEFDDYRVRTLVEAHATMKRTAVAPAPVTRVLTLQARAVAAEVLEGVNTLIVCMAENADGTGRRLELSRALAFDDQDRRLGQDTMEGHIGT